MNKKTILNLLFFCLLGIFAFACTSETGGGDSTLPDVSSNKGQAGVVERDSEPNILRIAIESADHTTLVAGVQAVEMENVLVNPGPLTVFAPTNAAFDKLPEGTLETLLKPENKDKLRAIITSHAAPSVFKGDMLKDGMQIYMASGHHVKVELRDGETYVNGARILGTVEASNGVVHVVDSVFLVAAE